MKGKFSKTYWEIIGITKEEFLISKKIRYPMIITDRKFKSNARKDFHLSLKKGLLKRQPCFCGDTKSEGHHEDYSKPLEIIWLCRKHHVEADKNRRKKLSTPHH